MTTYKLSGVVTDDEGVRTNVRDFTSSVSRCEDSLAFYLTNNFSGRLVLVHTELNGIKYRQTILLGKGSPRG